MMCFYVLFRHVYFLDVKLATPTIMIIMTRLRKARQKPPETCGED